MAFDNTCKFIAENFSRDIARWLLGRPMALTKMEPSELSVEPIRADAMILLEAADLILHVEFQTDPDPEMAFRMADYRLRAYRRYPHKQMRQIVVYLRSTQSPHVYERQFELPGMHHEFEVIRLWEQSPESFLSLPGLLPFAPLTQTTEKVQVLRDVAQRVDQIEDRRVQANISAATGILAGLLLETEVSHQVLRRDIMRESVIFQEIETEAEARGEARGKLEGELTVILRLLHRRLGLQGSSHGISADVKSKIRHLSLEQLEKLGDDLLDFQTSADLADWLDLSATD